MLMFRRCIRQTTAPYSVEVCLYLAIIKKSVNYVLNPGATPNHRQDLIMPSPIFHEIFSQIGL